MPIQYINTGTAANKGNGDTLRVAFNKVNDNFRQLASPLGLSKGTVGEVISNPALQTGITVTYSTVTQYATFALNTATAFQLGGIRVGSGLTINPTTGVLSGFDGSYNSLTNIPQALGTTSSPSFNNIFAASINLNQYAVTVDNFGNLIVNSRPLLETLDFAGSSITSIDPVQPLQLISFNTSTRVSIELYPGYSSVLVTGDLSGRQPNTYNLGDDQNPWRGIWVGTNGINFSDGSSIKTANGLGGGSVFQLTSSTAQVTLTSDGSLTFPNNTLKSRLLASGTSTNVATVLNTGTNSAGVDFVAGTFTLANIPANIPTTAFSPAGWYISGSGLVGQKPIAQTRDYNPGAGTITIRVDRRDGSTFRVATEPNNVYVISQYFDNFNIQVVDKIWNFNGATGQLTAPGSITATNFIGNLTGTASYALSFNTSTLVALAVTSTFAQSFNTSTLVAQAVSALTANTASYATTASSLANGVYSLVLGTTGTVTSPGNIMPTANLAYDLGSPTLQWRSLYVGTSTIFIGGVPISINTVTSTLQIGSASTTTVANLATENYVFNAISTATATPTAIGGLFGLTTTATLANTALGFRALNTSSTGTCNIAIGYGALLKNTTGRSNIAIGVNALSTNTRGYNNIALGNSALFGNTLGMCNTAIGTNALASNVGGTNNVAIGYGAMLFNKGGFSNTAIGSYALLSNTTGNNNTAIGANALSSNVSGSNNVAIGYGALQYNTIGYGNSAIGLCALSLNTTGCNNLAVGGMALPFNTFGCFNVAIGPVTSFFNTTGSYNIASGYGALCYNTVGNCNIALGYQALFNNVSGCNNLAIGTRALYNSTGTGNNLAIGIGAGCCITTGTNNTIIGNLTGTNILSNTVLIGAGTIERIKVDNSGLFINGALFTGAATTSTLQQITNVGFTTTNQINITNTTGATSTNTGALVVTGGVGVGGSLYVGGTVTATNVIGVAGAGTTATTSAALGYIGMPQTSTATSYTLVAADQGKHIYITATAQTITIPANATVAFPIGTTISLIAGPSSTSTTISITSDTMYLGGTGTTGNRTLAAYGMATLVKVSATAWYINGSGLT